MKAEGVVRLVREGWKASPPDGYVRHISQSGHDMRGCDLLELRFSLDSYLCVLLLNLKPVLLCRFIMVDSDLPPDSPESLFICHRCLSPGIQLWRSKIDVEQATVEDWELALYEAKEQYER